MAASAEMGRPIFCGAKLTRGQAGDCRRPAGWGTNHPGWGRCRKHAGSTPSGVDAAQWAQAGATAALFGVPREVHPIDGILEAYYRTVGIVDAIEAMCVQLMPRDVVWSLLDEKTTEDASGEQIAAAERRYGAGISVWVKLLAEWHDRMIHESEIILKLDLAARRLDLNASVVAALTAVLLHPDLALDENQRRAAARLLREMDARSIEGSVA